MNVLHFDYQYTVTSEPDDDFHKYLARKLRESGPAARSAPAYCADGKPLDISLDDPIGDVVAGIGALTVRGGLHILMLWVDARLRGKGIGSRLVAMAEEIAVRRGCMAARVSVSSADGRAFYEKLGYTVSGKLQPFPHEEHYNPLPRPFSRRQRQAIRVLNSGEGTGEGAGERARHENKFADSTVYWLSKQLAQPELASTFYERKGSA